MNNTPIRKSFAAAKKRITFILILVSAIAIQGCTSLFKEAKYSIYNKPTSGDLATIVFDFEGALPGQSKKSTGKEILFSRSSANRMLMKAVKIYDDPVNCVDYQIALKPDFQSLPVEAEKLITIEYRAIANSYLNIMDGSFVWCQTTFSFVPEAGQKYIAKKSAKLYPYRNHGTCAVRVFKEGSDTPVPIISREDTPIAWTGLSPRCDKEDVEEPDFVEKANSNFQCMIERTRMPC